MAGISKGIEEHLDYLQELGVTTVWTTPVYENHEAESYHGYGATDMYAVDRALWDAGGFAGAGAGAACARDEAGAGHGAESCGAANPWVKDEPAPDWFHGTAAHHIEAETNFQALIDPHAPERDEVGTLDGWFANVAAGYGYGESGGGAVSAAECGVVD